MKNRVIFKVHKSSIKRIFFMDFADLTLCLMILAIAYISLKMVDKKTFTVKSCLMDLS